MAVVESVKDYNTFIKGIVTEANALTFPENASLDEQNFVLNTDGSRQRRLGMDFEEGYIFNQIANAQARDGIISLNYWNNADDSGLNSFVVVQVQQFLHFYDLNSLPLSLNKHSYTLNMSSFASPWAPTQSIGSTPIGSAVGKGAFFVSTPYTEPFYIEYDSITDTFSATQYSLSVRDFIGLPESTAVEDRPATLLLFHKYNLDNQGWGANQYTAYFSAKSVYPSNADIWILAKDTNDDFQPDLLDKKYFGNTRAPSGHNVIDLFRKDRTAVDITLPVYFEKGRPSVIGFYASRAFYSGIASNSTDGISSVSNIYFSQILTDLSKAGNCYQESDPTSEEISDLLQDDGGVIPISDIGKVLEMKTLYDSLVVFADNGIWQIKGDADTGFNALSYQVQKVTDLGPIGRESIVVAEKSIFYWADSGIFSLEASEVTGFLQTKNLTETTVQTLYKDIPSISKLYAKGLHDTSSNIITWLYNDDSSYDGVSFKSKYNKELVLDLVLGSYTKNSIGELSSESPYVAGSISTPSIAVSDVQVNIVQGGVQLHVAGVPLHITQKSPVLGNSSTVYFTVSPIPIFNDSSPWNVTWSLYNNTEFIDWEKKDTTGIDSEAFLLTGYETFGDSSRSKRTPYIISHFKRTETGFITNPSGGTDPVGSSSCLMQARWGWSDSVTSGRWSTEQQLYRLNRNYLPVNAGDPFDYGFSVVTTKSKVRGSGEALSINFRSEPKKDLHILGWTSTVIGQTKI